MAKFSTGLRNGMLNATGFKEALDGGVLKIFAATTPPTTADAAETGTLLMTLTSGGDGVTGLTFDTPADGIISKAAAEVWMTSSVAASGNCTYFRFVKKTDTGASSTTEPRVQGSIGLMNSDMNLTSVAVTATNPWTLNYFNVGLPTT